MGNATFLAGSVARRPVGSIYDPEMSGAFYGALNGLYSVQDWVTGTGSLVQLNSLDSRLWRDARGSVLVGEVDVNVSCQERHLAWEPSFLLKARDFHMGVFNVDTPTCLVIP